MFWEDTVVKILFFLGTLITMVFFGWVALLQALLPHSTEVEASAQVITSTQIFLYPGLALVIFVGALSLARQVYRSNRSIAYRILATGNLFQIICVVLAYWAARQF